SQKRLFVVLAVEEGFADGITVDSLGRIWVALFGGWGVNCYSPAGELLRTVKLPVAHVTKLALGGDDLMTGYVTTARKGLTATELQQQPLAGCVFSFRTDVPGLPANEASASLIGGPAT
ncbi:MAG TPA: SMP-30/gluconolactonase/LRE family protein, partial [Burkholderiaceae bacterium]|nr:SMP-30/gluconolactonase/LRE family protein [Burkholderiaceae bacterium]